MVVSSVRLVAERTRSINGGRLPNYGAVPAPCLATAVVDRVLREVRVLNLERCRRRPGHVGHVGDQRRVASSSFRARPLHDATMLSRMILTSSLRDQAPKVISCSVSRSSLTACRWSCLGMYRPRAPACRISHSSSDCIRVVTNLGEDAPGSLALALSCYLSGSATSLPRIVSIGIIRASAPSEATAPTLARALLTCMQEYQT